MHIGTNKNTNTHYDVCMEAKKTQLRNVKFTQTCREDYSAASLLSKWTKTTDPEGEKPGHTCLHTNDTLWDNLAPFLQRKATQC